MDCIEFLHINLPMGHTPICVSDPWLVNFSIFGTFLKFHFFTFLTFSGIFSPLNGTYFQNCDGGQQFYCNFTQVGPHATMFRWPLCCNRLGIFLIQDGVQNGRQNVKSKLTFWHNFSQFFSIELILMSISMIFTMLLQIIYLKLQMKEFKTWKELFQKLIFNKNFKILEFFTIISLKNLWIALNFCTLIYLWGIHLYMYQIHDWSFFLFLAHF